MVFISALEAKISRNSAFFRVQVILQPGTTQKKTLKQKKAQQHKKKLICQARYFHNAFLNHKTYERKPGSDCNSH